ncbi:MAG: hypothetical protein Q9219_001130 [cf. Caloplaca sp. 3 TL-2023]
MPPEVDGQDMAAANSNSGQQDPQDTNHLHPTMTDSTSDNDVSERPVREKLKKTSIASMPRHGADKKPLDTTVEPSSIPEPDEPQKRDSPSDQTPSPTSETRGRLSRKRSYDDTVEPNNSAGGPSSTKTHHKTDDANHARKRSRDVRTIDPPTLATSAPVSQLSPLEGKIIDERSLNDETLDEETEESAQSPRKKRSRDELEADAQRELKIAATDEAKAYRRSEDSERGQLNQPDDAGAIVVDSPPQRKQDGDDKIPADTRAAEPSEPVQSPSLPAPRTPSPHKLPNADAESKAAQKPPTSFAASGFAAMSASSKSPFGALGASTPSVFRSNHTTTSEASNASAASTEDSQSKPTGMSAFGSSASPFAASTSGFSGKSGFGFGANGAASKAGSFGPSVFDSAFTTSSFSAPKLTSFAAPTGDLAPPRPTESTKAFGSPADDSGEEDGGSEGDGNPEEVGAGDAEIDSRFQQQQVETGEDGEESIFQSSRAQLYYFDSGGWHEKGKGAFKLNVASSDRDEKNARFIMRAHQTFRVLLNQPIFKKMQVGDSKGREPQGKNFSFAVVDQGRPTPHLLKLSDENESKALYREVLKLQREMETLVA